MSDSEDAANMRAAQPQPPPPSSPSLCSYCCRCLSSCFSQDKKKFAGIEYELVPTSGEGLIFNNLPEPEVKKRFTLPQTKMEYAAALPSLGGSGAMKRGEQGGGKVVKRQPMARDRSFSEPSLPPGFIPDPSMFNFSKKLKSSTLPLSAMRAYNERHLNGQGSPRTSPLRSSPPSMAERQFSAPAAFDYDTSVTGSWRPSLSAIQDVVEPGEEAMGLRRSAGEFIRGTSGGQALPPEVEFSLYYDIQCRTLMVNLQCARFLPNRAKKAGLNPIVLLYLLPNREDIFQTKMIENTPHPVFNQSFKFTGLMPDEIRRQTLVFRVFSHTSKGDLLGGLSVSLSEADLFGVMCRRNIDTDIEKLKLVSRGDLLISLSHNPTNQTLQGLLLKATNLQKQDIVGLADPYVKIWLLKKGRRNQKWKSKVKRNTLIPIFNESFQFDLSDVSVKEAALEILMMDYDRFSRNDVVGVVYIGEEVPNDTGKQHWDHVMSQPNTSISSWHTILPISAQMERTTRKKKVSQAISSRYSEEGNDNN